MAALELALTLPLLAVLVVAGLGLVDVARTSMVTQEAARLGARVAAVDADDGAVRRAVLDVVGPGAEVTIGVRAVRHPVRVSVTTPVEVASLRGRVTATAVALVEPVVQR